MEEDGENRCILRKGPLVSTAAHTPTTVAVVGAGMVGLATAWFLQERGVEVTVLDREGVGAGASWGNAGWLTPGIATPLPEPAVLKYGLKAVFSPNSPVYVPPLASRTLIRFVTGFTAHSTMKAWRRAMASLVPINDLSLDGFDRLTDGGVDAPTLQARSFTAAYRTKEESHTLLEEFRHIKSCGGQISWDVLDGDQARAVEPALSEEIAAALVLHDQRYINPGVFVDALAASVVARGGKIVAGAHVADVKDAGAGVVVTLADGTTSSYDQAVVATGAWFRHLVTQLGVTRVVQAGRGYSFSVNVDSMPTGPVYFPSARIACTPLGDRLRVAGMMEFRRPSAPLDPRRIQAIVEAARPLLKGADLDHRQDEWVGSRPCTIDGLPLIGATRSPRVFVAGGHGMWGITLGPVTGRLLAEQMTTGRVPLELRPFNPLR